MEQNAPIVTPVIDNNKSSDGKGLKIAIVITSVVALCGIGLGVYGVVQSSQKDSQISDLKSQIEESNKIIETPSIETHTDDKAPEPITDTATDAYENFADNLAKNYAATVFGYYWHWTGSDNAKKTVAARIENSHLTITDLGDINDNPVVVAEADDIIGAHYIEIGNGGVPYLYLIKKDGGAARINISENSSRVIENLNGYEKIVSISSGGNLCAYLIDIDGNVYENS